LEISRSMLCLAPQWTVRLCAPRLGSCFWALRTWKVRYQLPGDQRLIPSPLPFHIFQAASTTPFPSPFCGDSSLPNCLCFPSSHFPWPVTSHLASSIWGPRLAAWDRNGQRYFFPMSHGKFGSLPFPPRDINFNHCIRKPVNQKK